MLGQHPIRVVLVNPENRVLTRRSFATHAEAITEVNSWIETVYNSGRRHSALGQISPAAFEH